MPRVLNKHRDKIPLDAVYIGRPSKWGNQFSHQNGTLAKFKVASREEAVEKHKEYIKEISHTSDLFNSALNELRGKDLVCFCAPLPCHGDILLKMANV